MKTALLLASAAFLGMTATAQPMTASDAEDVLTNYGATLTSSTAVGEDAHTIDAQIDDINMTVRLGGCDADALCSYAMMFATFDLGAAADQSTLEKTNGYNDSFPFGRAFVIPGEDGEDIVGIDYVIDISSDANLDGADIARFEEILNSYITHWTAEN
ncbi:YbjN domain-containing protein [Henriciella sp. AS95]|uniref:YbjN domain-containing protein n=1 Tax=Henriciella sp. AS95 TaxID=3135782 RepID=UPI003181A1BA